MTDESPQESLQHYFDDLLIVGGDQEDCGYTPAPAKLKENAKVLVDTQEGLREKERQAKQKLEKLLSSTAVTIEPSVVDVPIAQAVEEPCNVEVVSVANEALLKTSEPEVVDSKVSEEVAEPEVGAAESLLEALSWEENGRPIWAQERFDVLLFSVSGLTLAVPLIALGQIQPLTEELTPLFGQADWFMGLQPTPMGKIRTVNTSKFVMPERYDESFLESAKYVISIDGLPWGLAVDAVNQPITLEPEDVKWRSERSKRAWLAGTVKQHMCALIDIPMMGQLLENEDRAKKI